MVAVGVLKVDGPACIRIEDQRSVALSSFHERVSRGGLRYELAWCQRARGLRLELGTTSIALDGPLRIEVGSDEHYPGCPTEDLPRSIRERLCGSTVVSSHSTKLARHGVFRSLKDSDPVAVVGLVERDSAAHDGAGWRLRPDGSGALSIWYRRRPRVRGPFGTVTVYAAALCP